MNEIAAFVNFENVLDKGQLKNILDQLNGIDIYFSERGNEDIYSLCTGTNGNFLNYNYVFLLNPPEPNRNYDTVSCRNRQNYYLQGLVSGQHSVDKIVSLFKEDDLFGAFTVPTDYVEAENWEHYERFASDYYGLKKWAEENHFKVAIDREKPPIIGHSIAAIRTDAIKNMHMLSFDCYTSAFIGYAISLLVQENGYLPGYVLPQELLLNNYLGYEALSSWQPEIIKTKKQYYDSLENSIKDVVAEMTGEKQKLLNEYHKLFDAYQEIKNSKLGRLSSFEIKLKQKIRKWCE